MKRPERDTPDLRRHFRQTEARLVLGGFGLALVVGGILIWHYWGGGAAAAGLLCMGGILSVFALLWALLKLMEIVSRSD